MGARMATGDPASQAVRFRRFLLGATAYAVCLPLLWICTALGLIAAGPALAVGAAIVAANFTMYVAFRTGLNERFADPSLTWAQVITGTVILLFAIYHLDQDRAIALLICFVILSFGVFRFNVREFFTVTGLMLGGYAAVINLLMWRRPDVVNVPLEWAQWATLAFALPCFALVGGKVSELRQRLGRTNEELASALAMVQTMATHDTLTGLPNRTHFNEALGQAIAQAQRQGRGLAILFMDVDRFKNVNDTLGHGVGDRVLQDAARRLQGSVRSGDLVARLGGDEFVVLVEDFGGEGHLTDIAGKIVRAFQPAFAVAGHELVMSASIGICTYPEHGPDAATLLSNADIAMYRAKEQGRNRACFYSADLNVVTQERLALEAGLRQALARNELDVLYQPKISFATGRVTGVEALIRWRHPELGLVTPDRFVPIAEEMGLIVPMGYWVMRRVCDRLRRWNDYGLSLSAAVNLSATQFLEPDLAKEIAVILRLTGVNPAQLEIEVTESMVMKDPDRAADVMWALRRMGVRLSIDDFGTGHSSLGYLKRFPIDRLKVDKSFVRDLPHNSDDVAITRAVIAMAHSLRMTVVAEGVEHQHQHDLLREEGCDEYQGYFCRPALEEDELMRFLMEERGRSAKVIRLADVAAR